MTTDTREIESNLNLILCEFRRLNEHLERIGDILVAEDTKDK